MPTARARTRTVLIFILALVAGGCSSSGNGPTSSTPVGGPGSTGVAATTPGRTTAPGGSAQPQPSAAPSGSTQNAAGSWTKGTTNSSTNVEVVACGSPTFCLNPPNVWNGTTWASMSSQPSVGPATYLGCLPSGHCLGIANDNFTTWDGSKWTVGKNFYQIGSTQGGVSITSISCPTESFCAAVDMTYGYAFIWNGSRWSDPTTIDPAAAKATAAVNAGSGHDIDQLSVACAGPTFCAVLDTLGNATTFDGKAWTTLVPVSTTRGAQLRPPLACPSATYCLASVGGGFTTWNGSGWSAPASNAPAGYPANPQAFQAVSCGSADSCVVVGSPGASDWGIFRGVTFSRGAARVGIQQPEALSCPTPDFCMTVGPYEVATWHR